ncbi:unnamed protein product, partial [Iphiclides podalirius]
MLNNNLYNYSVRVDSYKLIDINLHSATITRLSNTKLRKSNSFDSTASFGHWGIISTGRASHAARNVHPEKRGKRGLTCVGSTVSRPRGIDILLAAPPAAPRRPPAPHHPPTRHYGPRALRSRRRPAPRKTLFRKSGYHDELTPSKHRTVRNRSVHTSPGTFSIRIDTALAEKGASVRLTRRAHRSRSSSPRAFATALVPRAPSATRSRPHGVVAQPPSSRSLRDHTNTCRGHGRSAVIEREYTCARRSTTAAVAHSFEASSSHNTHLSKYYGTGDDNKSVVSEHRHLSINTALVATRSLLNAFYSVGRVQGVVLRGRTRGCEL